MWVPSLQNFALVKGFVKPGKPTRSTPERSDLPELRRPKGFGVPDEPDFRRAKVFEAGDDLRDFREFRRPNGLGENLV